MIGWLSEAYPWIKSLHIVSMVAWMAGLLYLPRLYVYHSMAPVESELSETFKVMERRLLRGHHDPRNACYMGLRALARRNTGGSRLADGLDLD